MRRSITLEKRPCNMKRIAIPELIEYTTIFFKLFKRKETFFSWNEKSNKIVKEILSLTSWWNVSFCQVDKERSFLVDLRLNSTRKELSLSSWQHFPCFYRFSPKGLDFSNPWWQAKFSLFLREWIFLPKQMK